MKLTDDTFQLYAIKHYSNHGSFSIYEFEDDLKLFTLIKRLLSKDNCNIHLLLNHIITVFNIFDTAALYILLYKIEEEKWNDLFTYLVFINRLPNKINGYNINISDYTLNPKIVEELRKI